MKQKDYTRPNELMRSLVRKTFYIDHMALDVSRGDIFIGGDIAGKEYIVSPLGIVKMTREEVEPFQTLEIYDIVEYRDYLEDYVPHYTEKDLKQRMSIHYVPLSEAPMEVPKDCERCTTIQNAHVGNIFMPDSIEGELYFGFSRLYNENNVTLNGKLVSVSCESTSWVCKKDLILADHSLLLEEATTKDDFGKVDHYGGIFLDIMGNLYVSESAVIRGGNVHIIVYGNLICHGEIDITGHILVMGNLIVTGKIKMGVRDTNFPLTLSYIWTLNDILTGLKKLKYPYIYFPAGHTINPNERLGTGKMKIYPDTLEENDIYAHIHADINEELPSVVYEKKPVLLVVKNKVELPLAQIVVEDPRTVMGVLDRWVHAKDEPTWQPFLEFLEEGEE